VAFYLAQSMKMNSDRHLILASNSPRRKEIMQQMGYSFVSGALPTDESFPASLDLESVAEFLARNKNKVHRKHYSSETVITADTTVILGNQLLEKAIDFSEAKSMLSSLSGKSHRVITGVCVSNRDKVISFSDTTTVVFRQLEEHEITHYLHEYEPYDKAGAYGIQEWIGLIGIEKIEGSYFNVVGLPAEKLYRYLKSEFGVTPQN
jgi:septum formation protein